MVRAMANPMGRPSLPYYVAISLLIASVAIGTVLFLLLVSRPSAESLSFTVGEAASEDCPPGERATVCYGFSLTNDGDAPGTARCTTIAAPGTQAMFLTGDPTVLVPLEAAEQRTLLVSVTAEDDAQTIGAAAVTCEPE
jgi:hypothetical protein